jgi:osmotically-inducible protein OsmY
MAAIPTPRVAPLTTESKPLPNILEAVHRQLKASSHNYLRCIQCAYDEGVLTLRGRVPSFYLKQSLQTVVSKIDGVRQIVNLVDVAA